MAKRSHRQIDAEIIAGLDVQAEYSAMGVRFAGGPRQSGKISCYAVGREDRRPSAWVNLRTGRYGDSGGGVADAAGSPRSLSLWDFAVQFGRQPDWLTARREFARKAGVKLGSGPSEQKWRDRLEFQSWDAPGNEILARRWCVSCKRGITVEAIKAAGGMLAYYPCFRDEKTHELRRKTHHAQVIALPAWGEQLLDEDPVAWVIWDVTGNDLDVFRGKDSPKDRAKMLSIGPTSGAMMGLHGLQRLTDGELRPAVKLAWKTAGPTDMMAVWSAVPTEDRESVAVVTNAGGELSEVLPHQAKLFADCIVRVIGDIDEGQPGEPGRRGAEKWCKELHGIAERVELCELKKLRSDET